MLTLQIGQCGNQLGQALFSKLAEEEPTDATFFRDGETFSSDPRVARAVLIDMEPKVVQQCIATRAATWRYDPQNVYMAQSGSGNNWAYGYCTHGTQHEHAMLELVRREAERCDLLRGFLVLQSVAGGTGSGLGSYLTEHCLPDAYPSALLLNAVVWPYHAGEVIVQNYNAVLTMASLADAADGIVVLQNDIASEICKRSLHLPRPSFHEINSVLATQLASAFLPIAQTGRTSAQTIASIGHHLCLHPGFKLIDIKMIPQMPRRSREFSMHSWSGILKHLHQMHITNAPWDEALDWQASLEQPADRCANTSLANLLILRGREIAQADPSAFQDPRMYAPWSLAPLETLASTRIFNAYDKTATLLSNSKALVPILRATTDKAFQMFAHNAYLHQYARHRVDAAFFQHAFLRVDQLVRNYETL